MAMNPNPWPLPPSYQALASGSLYFPQFQAGYLRLEGPDRLALLQRLSTNDLRPLQANTVIVTVLTSPTARLLDVLQVFIDGDALGVITLPGYGEATLYYLKSRIFFMDQVSISDLSQAYAQYDLDGAQAAQVLSHLGVNPAPGLEQMSVVERAGLHLLVLGQRGLAGIGYRLILPREGTSALEETLARAGAIRLSAEEHHILRLEAGLPAAGTELTADYTPLEVGLEWAISEQKGCYTGQEVIARQITYDKVTQRLVGLYSDVLLPPTTRLWAEGKTAGVITSAAISPRFGPIALAVLRRPYDQPGTILQAKTSSDQGVTARVTTLPFHA